HRRRQSAGCRGHSGSDGLAHTDLPRRGEIVLAADAGYPCAGHTGRRASCCGYTISIDSAPQARAGSYMMSVIRTLPFLPPAPIARAADTTTPIDNDQVKVLTVTQAPHVKTRLHDHKINRVMIYLQAGHQNIDYQDGKKVVLDWKPGEMKWSPASGMHIAEITSDKPVTIVEIELKKPGNTGKKASGALDPVKLVPKSYNVELENDQVRVLRVKIGPHQSVPVHEHMLNRVVTYITDQNFRVTTPDGKAETVQHKAGEVSWGTPTTHKEENLSDKPFEAVVVELKS